MSSEKLIEFRVATLEWEFEQIHRLNYRTFVDEIPQHEKNSQGRLVDKFHENNTYVICVRNNTILGMLAICDRRPFSLEGKLPNFFKYLPEHSAVCEVRLLSIEKEYRNTLVFSGLLRMAMSICLQRNYDLAIISGTTRQLKLYKHLGFTAFGGLVGKENALYQPMYIDKNSARKLIEKSGAFKRNDAQQDNVRLSPRNYMPGPVEVQEEVLKAFADNPVSHRSENFIEDFTELRKQLCQRVKAQHVQLFAGSGTLANDIVASHIGALQGKGLILVNGEFSQRLVAHAKALLLDFEIMTCQTGDVVALERVENYLTDGKDVTWLWTVACETSTGVLNDIVLLSNLAKRYKFKLCIDAISAIGCIPVDLTDVYLATAVSGKGIASLPGIALVFYQDNLIRPTGNMPRYFDLGHYEAMNGIPFTISSNAVYALMAALEHNNWDENYRRLQEVNEALLNGLRDLGLEIVARDNPANHVITITLPTGYNSVQIGDYLKEQGYLLSYRSEYLARQNWIQVCFMGNYTMPDERFVFELKTILDRKRLNSVSI